VVDAEERVERARAVEERAQLKLYAALENLSRYTGSDSEPARSQRSSGRSRGACEMLQSKPRGRQG
jgi:hypothetical protein